MAANPIKIFSQWFDEELNLTNVRIPSACCLSTIGKDKYFAERNRDSQKVSIVSNQGQQLNDCETLNKKYHETETKLSNQLLLRPESCGGYLIEPNRIEFLEFKPTRFHDRTLYQVMKGKWIKTTLQP